MQNEPSAQLWLGIGAEQSPPTAIGVGTATHVAAQHSRVREQSDCPTAIVVPDAFLGDETAAAGGDRPCEDPGAEFAELGHLAGDRVELALLAGGELFHQLHAPPRPDRVVGDLPGGDILFQRRVETRLLLERRHAGRHVRTVLAGYLDATVDGGQPVAELPEAERRGGRFSVVTRSDCGDRGREEGEASDRASIRRIWRTHSCSTSSRGFSRVGCAPERGAGSSGSRD